VLRFSREAYDEALASGAVEEDGVEAAFEVITDQPESVTSGSWVGDCFVYGTSTNRLNYLVGDKTYTLAHFDQPMYLLGYLPRDGRVYVCDRDLNVLSYQLSLSVVEYQTLVLRGDLDAAMEMLPEIPTEQKGKIARFLEDQGFKEEALDVATDPEHRFDLALSLSKLDIALELAKERDEEHKWRVVGDAALSSWDARLAEECFWHARDLGSLLLLYSATANRDGMRRLADKAAESSAFNIQFECLWLLSDIPACVSLLRSTGRDAEAVMFAKTYKPSLAPACVKSWKETLEKNGKARVSRMLAVPPGTEGLEADEELFPEWEEWLQLEESGGPAKLVDVDAEEDEIEQEGDAEVAVGTAGDVDGEAEE
jgi:coatomer subunit beta'